MEKNRLLVPFAVMAVVTIWVNHPLTWLLLATGVGFVAGSGVGSRYQTYLKDQVDWLKMRITPVGDMSLERETKMLRRRLAGLLSSPEVYERARRLVAPLEMEPTALAKELAVVDTSELDILDVDWPTGDDLPAIEPLDDDLDLEPPSPLAPEWLTDRVPALATLART
jgi:hypothetical protein